LREAVRVIGRVMYPSQFLRYSSPQTNILQPKASCDHRDRLVYRVYLPLTP